MNKRIDYTNLGGHPVDLDTLQFMQASYRGAFAGVANLVGNKVIMSGMVVSGGAVSNGWLSYNGELIPFTGGTLATDVVITEVSSGQVTFQDGAPRDVEFTKTATCGITGEFPFADLKRIDELGRTWLPGDIKEVDCSDAYIVANFDGTGLGINERAGWAICNGANGTRNRGGRVSMGYDTRTVDPGDGVWDILYNSMGWAGGEKAHTLTITEMPTHSHGVNQGNSFTGAGGSGRTGRGSDSPNTFTTGTAGSNAPHENRQPFIVTLFIQKL